MHAPKAYDVRVRDQVRVVTRCDGVRARSETPALTAIDLKLDLVAAAATQSLIGIIDKSGDAQVTPAPVIVLRDSSRRS